MPSAISSVRITPNANHLLNQLSGKLRQPKARVVEDALRMLEERLFWREVHDAFADAEPEEMRVERALWDSTVEDGFRDHW